MTRRKKLKQTYTKKKRQNYKGGLLMINPEQDLINTHLCSSKKNDKKKETAGEEVYTYNGDICQLNASTLGFINQQFRKSNGKWFKFIIFNNDDENYIYIINGGQINKHSVCMLIGLLDITSANNEYPELRKSVKDLIDFKLRYNPLEVFQNSVLNEQLLLLIHNIDIIIERDIHCMPVSAAGSGTVNDDDSICINNKSGHYKPSPGSMKLAQDIFIAKTGATIHVTEKVEKELLREKYGEEFENYTGICL